MAVLSNTEIIRALDDGRLVIDPRPKLGAKDSPFSTTSVDLRIAPMIRVPAEDVGVSFTPGEHTSLKRTLERLYDSKTISSDGFELKPSQFILGNTVEKVSLPIERNATEKYLAARIEGRSSFARQGMIVHFTAPTIHAGFSGRITLEIINLGKFPIVLRPEMRICQLVVETVEGVPSQIESQYQHQRDPIG